MMKTLCALSTCLMLAVGGVQAGTIQANLGFPDMDAFASQKKNDTRNAVWRTGDAGAVGGQSFRLDAETTLRAVTFQKESNKTFTGSPSEIWLFVGEYDTNGVVATTNLLETFDVSGQTLTNNLYYSLNFDSDLVLDAGIYAYQLWFNQTNASHNLAMKVGSSTTYTNGSWFWTVSSSNFPSSAFTYNENIGKDYTFGLHSAVVGVVPTVVQVIPDTVDMNFTLDTDGADGNTAFRYLTESGSNIVVSSISFSDESHPGAFTNLTAFPLVMSNAYPSATTVDFQFDNTMAGLTNTQVATATATIDWSEAGVTNGQLTVLLSATASAALPSSTITNTGSAFPTDDILLSQETLSTDGSSYIKDTLAGGQTFTLDANKTVSGFTFYVKTGSTLNSDDHSLKVWVGEMSGTTAGATIHESTINVSGHSLASGSYQRIDFAEELSLQAGSYGVQLAWGVGAVGIRLGNSSTNVYDGGQSQRFTYSGTLPVNGGGRANDLVFALHGVDGPEGYSAWLGGYDLGEYTNTTDNSDGDAYNNLYEYAMGGNPTDPSDIGYMTPLAYQLLDDGSTNWFEYVYARRIAATNELVYSLEMASDLVNSDWTAEAYTELPISGTIPDDADFEAVTNLVDMTGKSVEFIRVNVDEL